MSLAGLRILNPRPVAMAEAWTRSLQADGAEVLALPLLDYQPLPLTAAARQALLDLDRAVACIFVSHEAAVRGLAVVADWWPQWPLDVAVLAVGEATAIPLREAGLDVIVPEQASSEGLLSLPMLAAERVANQGILLFRADEGRELLRETLAQRGASVVPIGLYQRQLPVEAPVAWAALRQQGLPQIVLLSSVQIWSHWQQLAGLEATQPVLVVSSERLAATVTAAGATRVVVTVGATWPQWRAAIQQAARQIRSAGPE